MSGRDLGPEGQEGHCGLEFEWKSALVGPKERLKERKLLSVERGAVA